MTNAEIIQNEADLKNYLYDGENLFTFHEWKKRGFQVKKGEKAFITTRLWKYKDVLNKETGETEKQARSVPAHLFSREQVEPIKEKTAHAPTKVCGLSL